MARTIIRPKDMNKGDRKAICKPRNDLTKAEAKKLEAKMKWKVK